MRSVADVAAESPSCRAEAIDLLRRNDLPADKSTPVLRDTDPNLELTLKGLTAAP